ncbi:MAG: ECF transporter S component, partial [Acidobacteriota bacterium]
HWQPGLALQQTAILYVAFYFATSIWWDAGRAVANAVLLFALGEPLLRLLSRFQKRFGFDLDR